MTANSTINTLHKFAMLNFFAGLLIIQTSCAYFTSNRIEFIAKNNNYGVAEFNFYNTDTSKAIIATVSNNSQHFYYYNLETQSFKQITFGNNYNFDLHISQNDHFMVFSNLDKRKGNNPSLKIIDLTNFEELDTSPLELEGWNPFVYESNIYYTRYIQSNDIRKGANIYKYDIIKKTNEQITYGENYDLVVDVHPDEQLLYFLRGTRYYYASPIGYYHWRQYYYYSINLTSNETEQISSSYIPGDYNEQISFNKKYALQYSLGNLYLVNLASGKTCKILPKEGVLEYETRFSDFNKLTYPIFHPKEEKIFFVMGVHKEEEKKYSSFDKNIFSFDYKTIKFEQLGDFTKHGINTLTVSSDGKKILFRTTKSGSKGPLGLISIRLHDLWLYDIEKDILTEINLQNEDGG